jgi:hypothetical protein
MPNARCWQRSQSSAATRKMLGVTVDKAFIERGVSASVKPMATRAEGAKLLAALKPGEARINF